MKIKTGGLGFEGVMHGYRFDYGWDQRLIDELEKLKDCSPNPVISTYPPGIESVSFPARNHYLFIRGPCNAALAYETPTSSMREATVCACVISYR